MPGTGKSGGRNKKSAKAHVLRGTFRGDRHAKPGADSGPPTGRPEPPKPLEGEALEEWERNLDRLEQAGTLSVVDDGAMYQLACMFAETEAYKTTQGEVAGSVQILEENIKDLKGTDMVAAFQEISKMRKLEASYATQIRSGRMAIRQWLVEFGLTPAARSRVQAPPQKPKSKVDKFRQQKGA